MRTDRNIARFALKISYPFTLIISSAMFHHCSNFTIAGGTFTVLERPRSPPSDFRSVRLGDLNLLTTTAIVQQARQELHC
ncbi:hypothetical protein B0H17DRAFT_1203504 [Mycena rosella]|uniref:Uncharacterized protein n=1 Tax=Mycena rosella TaxID=1033263 RepID=A0AAD7GC76_MYCRO|nr:hypothetical protein B0H17DRAFT_1203504 [Mycena rosella]